MSHALLGKVFDNRKSQTGKKQEGKDSRKKYVHISNTQFIEIPRLFYKVYKIYIVNNA